MEEIKKLIDKLHLEGYTPVQIKHTLEEYLIEGMDYLLKEKYFTIMFDSPAGEESAVMLNAQGYHAKWYGPRGCRGFTYAYIPKNDKEFSMKSFEHMLEVLDLKDGGTHIIVK